MHGTGLHILLTSFFTVSYVMFSCTAISAKMKVLLTMVSVTFHVPISGFGNGAGVGGTAVVVPVVVVDVGSFVVGVVGVVKAVVLALVVVLLAVVVVVGVVVVLALVVVVGGPTVVVVEFGGGGCGGSSSPLPVHVQQRHNLKICQN